MRTLIKRSITGILFAAVMLAGITVHPFSFLLLAFVITVACTWEFYSLIAPLYDIKRISAKTYRLIAIFLSGALYILFVTVEPHIAWSIASLLPFAILAIELRSLSPAAIRNAAINTIGLIYITLPMLLLLTIPDYDAAPFFPSGCGYVLGLLLLIWTNDTLAYLGGTLFGRHKLYPSISPGKTWEGFIIGAMATIPASYLLYIWLNIYDLATWIGLAVIAFAAGTTGDLVESMIKRNVKVKDSGNILPGHGGLLDRFDAFIFCLPFAWVWLRLV